MSIKESYIAPLKTRFPTRAPAAAPCRYVTRLTQTRVAASVSCDRLYFAAGAHHLQKMVMHHTLPLRRPRQRSPCYQCIARISTKYSTRRYLVDLKSDGGSRLAMIRLLSTGRLLAPRNEQPVIVIGRTPLSAASLRSSVLRRTAVWANSSSSPTGQLNMTMGNDSGLRQLLSRAALACCNSRSSGERQVLEAAPGRRGAGSDLTLEHSCPCLADVDTS